MGEDRQPVRPTAARSSRGLLSIFLRRGIARNSAINLLGLGSPLLIGLLLLPYITRELGVVRFGILGLALAMLEYAALFSLGLTPASTKFAADAIARGERTLPELISVSVLSHAALGVVGGAVIALLAAPLVDHVFSTPAEVRREAIASFRLLGLMVPATLMLWSMFGALEAARRFGLMNLMRVPTSALSFVAPALGLAFGADLPQILLLLALARTAIVGVVAVVLPRSVPGFHWVWPREWNLLRPLLVFGAWVSVSNLANPLLIYGDRFMLGSIAGLAAVGLYTAPFDAILRLHVIPTAMVRALFPVVSARHTLRGARDLAPLFRRAVLAVPAILILPVAIIALWAPELLELWLGEQYRAAGTAARILVIAMLVNCMAVVPYTYLTAVGRPDITAKFHVAELAFHLPLTWFLVTRFGITGAAMAWATRVGVDTVLLFMAAGIHLRGGLAGNQPQVADASDAQQSSR